MHRDLEWIRSAVDGSLVLPSDSLPGGEESFDLALTTTDSRECEAKSIYVARVGESADGHKYVPSAVEAGASMVVVERPVDALDVPQVVVKDSTLALGKLAKAHLADLRSAGQVTVVGITGSAGKTTTKDLLARIAQAFGPTVAPKLSFNNEVGCPLTILEANESTRFIVLEMGASGPGHIAYLTDIAPLDIATVLMVGQAHLGGYGSEQALADAKAELVAGLVPGGTAVLNVDDAAVWAMGAVAPGTIVGFSAKGDVSASYRAQDVQVDSQGRASFTLVAPGKELPATLDLVGAHQVPNVLAAIATSQAMSLELSTAVEICESARADSPHRMAVHQVSLPPAALGAESAGQFTLLDDSYNANPDSMRAAFIAARGLASQGSRILMVLGEMLELGPTSEQIHREVGQAAIDVEPALLIQLGDRALYGGVSPAFSREVPRSRGQGTSPVVATSPDSATAHKLLMEELREGDVVLVKGSNGSRAWEVAELLLAGDSDDSPTPTSVASPDAERL